MSPFPRVEPKRFNPNVKGWLGVILAVFLLYTPFGCSSVSDEDMENLRLETFALEAELAAARQEAAVLDRALTSVYKERDALVDQIARATAELNGQPLPEGPLAGGTVQAGTGGQPGPNQSGQPRTYRAQTGDSLSGVASRFGTSVQTLLDLNPYLKNRTNQMVWVGDVLTLPAR
ncbi:MAG: LysM domain-containing protein [Deltaproteobacteria bacterium]|jgi:LysM repeat protein|nr:LysM domain-containing protein [Deltaproteobacteria bacterium]